MRSSLFIKSGTFTVFKDQLKQSNLIKFPFLLFYSEIQKQMHTFGPLDLTDRLDRAVA